MTTKTKLKIVDADIDQAEAEFHAASGQQTAPMVQRLATHRDKIDLAVKELESERFDLISRRDNLRRQYEAIESGMNMHIADIEQTMRLYEGGLNALPTPERMD